MVKAKWNGETIAESEDIELVEGNHYFPVQDVNKNFLEDSDHTSFCGWKGKASYYHVVVNGKKNENAAWYYADPMEGAEKVKDRIAFWKGVEVE